jgi:hypothetical protein
MDRYLKEVHRRATAAEDLLAIGRRCAATLKSKPVEHAPLLYDDRGLEMIVDTSALIAIFFKRAMRGLLRRLSRRLTLAACPPRRGSKLQSWWRLLRNGEAAAQEPTGSAQQGTLFP